MPLGLKNAEDAYQQPVNKIFKHQIGKNMEVYVADMLVESAKENDHIKNLQDPFTGLKKYDKKPNPQKCIFRVVSKKFLGFIVTSRGIEANSDKIKAILDVEELKILHDT